MKTVIYKTPVLCALFGKNSKPFSRICALFDRSCKPFSRICALFGGSCTLFSGSSTLFGRNCKPAVLFAGLLLLASCSRDGQPLAIDDDTDGNGDSPVNIVVSRNAFTGAGDNGDETETKFTPGCLIGVTVEGSSEYTNVQYEYKQEGSALKATAVNDKVYCKANSNQKVKAYYPYRSDGLYTQAYVQADQSTEADYYASDALEATGYVREGLLDLQFSHRMAKVIFTFNEAVSGVTILNQSLNTGSTTGSSGIKCYKGDNEGKKWKAFIVPGQTELKITGKNSSQKAFNATFTVNSAMLAGGQYNYTITELIDISNLTRIDLSAGSVSFSDNGIHYIIQNSSEPTNNNITVTGGAPTIYIDGLNIKSYNTAFNITGGTPTIVLIGTNSLESTGGGQAGIQLSSTANVKIKGPGGLTVKGNRGAGIGAAHRTSCGNIHIEDCTIVATTTGDGLADNDGSAGIGGSVVSQCGNITILNSNITAQGSAGGAGIGCGYGCWTEISRCGDITISNSTVTAEPSTLNYGSTSAAIGTGGAHAGSASACGKITIILKPGQSKTDFHNYDKVGCGTGNTSCGTITWKDSDGQVID